MIMNIKIIISKIRPKKITAVEYYSISLKIDKVICMGK